MADAKDALGLVLHAAAAPYRIGLDELPVVTVACAECGAATELVRRSHSDARRVSCDDCRFRTVMQAALAPRWDDHAGGWLDPPVWRTDPRGDVDEARRRGLIDPEVEDLDGPLGW